jgi:predicted RNase H-like HicB family nuclease
MKQNGENMLSKDIEVEAFWDEEARVWVASSNDVPGLITEADTMEQLMQKLKIIIPELLQANGLLNEPGTIDIPIHLLGKWQEVIKTPSRNG